MVLQRNQSVPVWGEADPGARITVEFAGQRKSATAGAAGEWRVTLGPLKASTASRPFHVSGPASRISLANVLVGDVWLCAGQSNMAQTMKRYLIWEQVKHSFANDQVRLFKIREGGVGSPEPTKAVVIDPFFDHAWQVCTPEYAAEFSATAGFFGMKLQRDTGIPVGLLYANRGGTRANMWMPHETLRSKSIYERFLDASNQEWKPSNRNPGSIRAPSYLYNGTIHPLAPFAIRGVIWYQGESDSQYADIYEEMMGDLIASWRAVWGFDFPFLYVQLAPWDRVGWDEPDEGWAWQREAQLQMLKSVPHSGMAVIIDGGEAEDIHPQAKNLPGERLAVLAAALDNPGIDADFPAFAKWEVKRGKALLSFEGVSGGLKTRRVAMNLAKGFPHGQGADAVTADAGELKGFTICGADRQFAEAQARIVSKDSVLVWSPDVKEPVAVRYGWSNFPLCNLYGGNGMPASPFRTDDFPKPNLTGEKSAAAFDGVVPEWGRAMEILNAGDGTYRTAELGGQPALKADGPYLYARTDRNEPGRATVHVVYLDEGYGVMQLRYDSTSEELFAGKRPGVWKPAGEVSCRNSGLWKSVRFELPDCAFGKRCNGGDIRLQSTGALTVSGIYVGVE
jgi:sialate O-acetylesterase